MSSHLLKRTVDRLGSQRSRCGGDGRGRRACKAAANGLLPQLCQVDLRHAPRADNCLCHLRQRLLPPRCAGAAAVGVKRAGGGHDEEEVLERLGHRLEEELVVGGAQVRLEESEGA